MDAHLGTLMPLLSELVLDRLVAEKLEATIDAMTGLVRATGL